MIKKEYKVFELNSGEKDITIIFDIKHHEVLTTFLYSDVLAFEDYIKAQFDKVLLGKSDYQEIGGNVCKAEIGFSTTKIYDIIIEDDKEYYNSYCEVDTKERRQLIDEWCDRVREFKIEQCRH